MKKILLTSIIACNALFGTIVVPDISILDNCQQRDKISQLEPEAKLKDIQNWFEKANQAEENLNLDLMLYLTKPRTTLEIKKNLMYLTHAVKSKDCTQKVMRIERDFDLGVYALKETLRNPSPMIEEISHIEELKPQVIVQELQPRAILEKIKPKEVIKATVIDKSYYAPYESKPSNIYIVSVRKGVNVRDNPLLGKKSNIMGKLPYATGLVFKESVRIGVNETWGQFVYLKNNVKKIGWIHMNYVRQSK